MTALDTLVVTNALPVLRVDLGASMGDLEWTVNAYNLAFVCLLLTGAMESCAGREGCKRRSHHRPIGGSCPWEVVR